MHFKCFKIHCCASFFPRELYLVGIFQHLSFPKTPDNPLQKDRFIRCINVILFCNSPFSKKENNLKNIIRTNFNCVRLQRKSISIVKPILQKNIKKQNKKNKKNNNVTFYFVIPFLLWRTTRYISNAVSFVVSLTSVNSLKRHYSLQWVRSDDKKFIFVCLKDYNKLSWSVRNWAVSVSNHHCWKKQTHHSSKFTCLSGVSGFLYSQKPLKIDKCVLIVLYSTEEVHPKSFDAELLFIFFL